LKLKKKKKKKEKKKKKKKKKKPSPEVFLGRNEREEKRDCLTLRRRGEGGGTRLPLL